MAVKNLLLFLIIFFYSLSLFAQEIWAGYHQKIPVAQYRGYNFRLEASARVEDIDDSAAIRFFVRVESNDKPVFFENMKAQGIRTKKWKKISITGKIDESADSLFFGPWIMYNGNFFLDDVIVSVSNKKGKWQPISTNNFEKGENPFKEGTGSSSGVNKLYSTYLFKEQDGNTGLKIEGKQIPTYGVNSQVGKWAKVNGIELYYETYGEGQPLVVLHGNGGAISNASLHYPALVKKYKVIAIDSRGQGRSGDADIDLNYELMASDVNELLNQINVDSALVWGQSDGAILGLLLAINHPRKVKKVLAFGANVQPDSLAVFPWAIESIKKKVASTSDVKVRKLNKLMLEHPHISYEKLKTIKAPVLVMAGDRDVIREEHTVKIFQSIPNSHLCIIPGSTHGAAWEKRELFLTIAFDFFDKPFKMPSTKSWME